MSDSKISAIDLRMALLQAQTRRHFLRTLGSGLGTLFVGTSMAKYVSAANNAGHSEGSALDFARGASTPLSELPPQFAAKVRRGVFIRYGGVAHPHTSLLNQHVP